MTTDPDSHWHDPVQSSIRRPVIRIGLALFALAVFGGVWAHGKAGGWW